MNNSSNRSELRARQSFLLFQYSYSIPQAALVILANSIIASACFLSELLSIKKSKCSFFLVTLISAHSSTANPLGINDSLIQKFISDLLLLRLRIQMC